MARVLTAHDGKDRSSDVHRAEQIRCELLFDLFGRHLFEVALEGRAGVVDDHVDPTEPLHRSISCRLSFVDAGDVELDGEQAVGLSQNPFAISSGRRPVATTASPAANAAVTNE